LSTSPVRDQAAIDFLSRQVSNPFFGIPQFAGTGHAAQRFGVSQLLRPYPHFSDVELTIPGGFSYYYSLQIGVEKRMSGGLTFQSAWTWSKFMEATTYRTASDPFPEKVVSPQDFTHRFVLSTIYEFPVGRGRKWFSSLGGVRQAVFGGWQLQGWFEGQSGEALGFGNAIFTGNLHDIEIPVNQRRAERWFNIDAGFNRVAAQQLANNIIGLSTRFNGVRADGVNNFDLSLFKNFVVREGFTTQIRIENYNALNHVQFGPPNTTPVNAAFGTITAEKGHGQRQLTFGIKAMF
jgi:hypothetical protein